MIKKIMKKFKALGAKKVIAEQRKVSTIKPRDFAFKLNRNTTIKRME